MVGSGELAVHEERKPHLGAATSSIYFSDMAPAWPLTSQAPEAQPLKQC